MKGASPCVIAVLVVVSLGLWARPLVAVGRRVSPRAAAFADDYYGNYDLVPNSADTIADGGIRNFLVEVPPAAAGSVQGTEGFDIDSPTGTQVGTIDADVTNTTDVFGNTNQEILVTSDDGYPT